MPKKKKTSSPALTHTWTLSPAESFGSTVRVKGILLEVRAGLPVAVRKSLGAEEMDLTLSMAEDSRDMFVSTASAISNALRGIERLPVIPREIERHIGHLRK